MSNPVLRDTLKLGQSVWLDFISRDLMDSGKLDQLISDGVRGMTSNPTIFENAIAKSTAYDGDIQLGLQRQWTADRIFEHLAVADVTRAADKLRPVYDESHGADGFVSIEVSPGLAHDAEGTLIEARRLWQSVNRPNVMIKVPGTKEGLPAIRTLLAEGLNINITLMFSLEQYVAVLEAYLSALEDRVHQGLDISRIGSVASFFVSRVDSVADKQLEAAGHKELLAKAAIANACLAYKHYLEQSATDRWKALKAKGARVQRLLWASTSTKNPVYSDVLYVEELVAEDTVNTIPTATLEAWMDHGKPAPLLMKNLATAEKIFAELAAAGININKITNDLIQDGVEKFAVSYHQLIQAIETKLNLASNR
jgi:transaldolase/glucose-6-phosphate isomerase